MVARPSRDAAAAGRSGIDDPLVAQRYPFQKVDAPAGRARALARDPDLLIADEPRRRST